MWLIIGLILGGLLVGMVMWMRGRGLSFTWYEWLIGLVGIALLLYSIANVFGSFTEVEPTAAWLFLLVFGLPALILLAVAWQLAVRRNKAA